MFEDENAEQKVVQINSKSWKSIIDKKKDQKPQETEKNEVKDGGFFLSFDSAP